MKHDHELMAILSEAHTLAVVGIKDREGEDAYRIPTYMLDHGYKIIPVNPKLERALGEPAYASLADIAPGAPAVDIVNLFRASAHVPSHVDEILALEPLPTAVWTQLGIRHDEAAARLADAGIEVVQDRCLMVEHRRLLGARAGAAAVGATPRGNHT